MIGRSQINRCRILNSGSCGSGSICGMRNGKALIMTNAHVAGSRLGRVVQVEVAHLGIRIQARVIMAAYSDRTLADWAVLETLEDWDSYRNTPGFDDIKPVKLSKKRPTGEHYTRGYPRCRPHNGTTITTVQLSSNSPLWLWEPDAIGGQSGSGVWSQRDHLQYGLLTWQWGQHGAGQMTSEIYRQARQRTISGAPKPVDLVEVGTKEVNEDDFCEADFDESYGTPELEIGFFAEANITTLPIWAEDDSGNGGDDDDDTPPNNNMRGDLIEMHRRLAEYHQDEVDRLEGISRSDEGGNDVIDLGGFGLPE